MCLSASSRFHCKHHRESAAEEIFVISGKLSSQEILSSERTATWILWKHRQIHYFSTVHKVRAHASYMGVSNNYYRETIYRLLILVKEMKYFSISLYRKMLNCAIVEGMKREDFMNLPTPIDTIDDLQAIPADEFFSLHELLDEKLGPGFGVRVGQQMKIEDYGVLGLSWRTCSWAGEIFERSERYFKLLSNTFMWQIKEEGDLSHVHLNREAHRRGLELSTEASLSATVVVLQAMTEKPIFPTQVAFKHSPPKDLNSYEEAFQCPIYFNQPHYSITYKTSDLRTRTAKADSSINQFLVQRVEEETNGLEVSGSKLVFDVEKLIADALPSGIPSIHHIAEHMGMSNRTLTRRLSETGISYRDLIKKTQEGLSKHLLKKSTRSVAEIAFETGFSEQSAFNRAFKRWTGLSPVEFRKS